MSDLTLVVPSRAFLDQVAAYKAEFSQTGQHLYGGARLENMANLEDWLVYVSAITSPEGVEEGRVPSSTFLCIRQSDQKMVGICNIRHSLDQLFLVNLAGHVGYSICPSERRKGYAKEQLRLALMEAGRLGIKQALVTCDVANLASERTILANGGHYESTYTDPDDQSETKRYWIEVTQSCTQEGE